MAFNVDREDTGMLFKNKEKKTESHPDYSGQVNIGGAQMRISAWIKDGKNGKYMSLSFRAPGGDQHKQSGGPEEFDDDIPF